MNTVPAFTVIYFNFYYRVTNKLFMLLAVKWVWSFATDRFISLKNDSNFVLLTAVTATNSYTLM